MKSSIKAIAQIKFLDGRIEGYLAHEVEMLKEWLTRDEPDSMKDPSNKRYFASLSLPRSILLQGNST